MLLKKEKLIDMIEKKEIRVFSIVGVPTKELQDAWFKGEDLLNLFDKYDISNKLGEFDSSSVSIYFPNFMRTQLTELCSLTINFPTLEQINNITKYLLTDTLDYYQVPVQPNIINKIVGIHQESITFSDMLMLIPEKSQSKIAENVGKSRQTITDIKSGKSNLTLEVLSKLMNLYPLLPWVEFIEQQV